MRYFLLFLIALVIGCSNTKNQEFSQFAYRQEFENGDLIIIKFGAEWCGPCHTLDRVIDNSNDIQQYFENNTKGYYKIDVDSNDPNDKAWVNKARPSSIPLVVKYTYEDNKWVEVKRFVGVRSEREILKWLE